MKLIFLNRIQLPTIWYHLLLSYYCITKREYEKYLKVFKFLTRFQNTTRSIASMNFYSYIYVIFSLLRDYFSNSTLLWPIFEGDVSIVHATVLRQCAFQLLPLIFREMLLSFCNNHWTYKLRNTYLFPHFLYH